MSYFVLLYISLFIFSNQKSFNMQNISKEFSLYDFQYKLFHQIILSKETENIILSPISIHQIISLSSNGAIGETQSQIVSALSSTNVVELNKENSIINSYIKKDDSMNEHLIISNGIFTIYPPKKTFLEICNIKYDVTSEQLKSAAQINEWCAKNTNNKISKIVDNIDQTIMILINAVYFKAQWREPFEPEFTNKELFNYNQQVDMMHQTYNSINYYEDKSVQIIEIPYKNKKFSSIIILPAEGVNVDEFFSTLTKETMRKYYTLMKYNKVVFSMPKFELEYEVTLNEIMKQLGMIDAFDENKANFSGITEDIQIFISKIKHKTYMKVDEFGTEAAAVTMMSLDGCCFNPEQKIYEMKVNRPFFFGIKNEDFNDSFIFMSLIKRINN